MTKCTRVHLSTDERFELLGRRIVRINVYGAGRDDDDVSLFARDGFVGTVKPSQVPEVMNAITARRGWVAFTFTDGR